MALTPDRLTEVHAQIPRKDWQQGHPTAIGPRDEVEFHRAGMRGETLDGVPGVPRLHPDPYRGPGKPGTTPAGPNQPSPAYDGPTDL